MKKTFKVALVASLLSFSATTVMAEKIGYLEQEYVIASHPLLAKGSSFEKMVKKETDSLANERKSLEAEEKKLIAEGNSLKKEDQKVGKTLTEKLNALEKNKKSLKSAEIAKKQAEIQKIAQDFQKKVNAYKTKESLFANRLQSFQNKVALVQEKIAKKEQETRIKVVKEVKEKIKSIAKKEGYDWVLSSEVIFFSKDEKGTNLSDKVIKALGGTPAKK